MDFLEIMDLLAAADKLSPSMRWDVHDGHLSIHLYIGQDNGKLLEDGRKMFAPL